jgi:cation transport ATPase
MTELNLAYELNDYEQPQHQPQHQLSPSKQDQQQQIQHQIQQQMQQQQYEYEQQQQQQASQQQRRHPEYSFWDRMIMSKREVMKLFILSIVIMLGISLEKLGFHYLSSYISSTDLTSTQEFFVRLSFPIIVFLILWIIKSL